MSKATATPDIVLFVTKFDILKGYSLIHQYPNANELSLTDGIEYKALPSGLHQSSFDIVRFKHFVSTDGSDIDQVAYDGVSIFRQNGIQEDIDSGDRKSIKMYSVGLLFTNEINETVSSLLLEQLDTVLHKFINMPTGSSIDDESKFLDQLNSSLYRIVNEQGSVNLPPVDPSSIFGAFNNGLPFEISLNHVGPYFYCLWRYLLTNKRILIKNQFDKTSFARNENVINVNTMLIKHLDYVTQSSIKSVQCDSSKLIGKPSLSLHNISLQDLDHLRKLTKQKRGFIACTSDDLILTKLSLFDYILEFDTLSKRPILKKVVPLVQAEANSNTGILQSFKIQNLKFSKADLINFTRLQSDKQGIIKLFSYIYRDWGSLIDNSWSTLLGEWIYGVPSSLNVNSYGLIDENKAYKDFKRGDSGSNKNLPKQAFAGASTSSPNSTALKDEEDEKVQLFQREVSVSSAEVLTDSRIKSHFSKLLDHYNKTFSDIIQNNDEDIAAKRSIDPFYDETEDEGLLNEDDLASESLLSHLDYVELDDEGVSIVELYLSDIHQLYLNPFSIDDREFAINYIKHNFNRTAKITSSLDILSWNPFLCC